jgi:hypothetical protein
MVHRIGIVLNLHLQPMIIAEHPRALTMHASMVGVLWASRINNHQFERGLGTSGIKLGFFRSAEEG